MYIYIYIYIYLQLTKAEKAGKIIVSQVLIVGMEISLSNAVSIGVETYNK